jgi:hypothetical protein
MPSTGLFRGEFSHDFLQWVLTKEKESCVFWLAPGTELDKLSNFFQEKIDPMSEQSYRPLLLDPQWWRTRFRPSGAKFVMNPSAVIASINANPLSGAERKPMDVPALQELIYQSNPTLEPTAKWPHAPSMRYLPRVASAKGGPGGNSSRDQPSCRGYIDHDRMNIMDVGQGGRSLNSESCRIGAWPPTPHTRLDDLHRSWHSDQASAERRNHLRNFGEALLRTS